MFLVHNITSGRLTFKIYPLEPPKEGTPNWRIRKDIRTGTVNVAIDPHIQIDLEKYGYSETQLLQQPEVLDFFKKGYLRRVVESAYVEKPHRPAAEIAPVAPKSVPPAPVKIEPVAPVPVELEPVTDLAPIKRPQKRK